MMYYHILHYVFGWFHLLFLFLCRPERIFYRLHHTVKVSPYPNHRTQITRTKITRTRNRTRIICVGQEDVLSHYMNRGKKQRGGVLKLLEFAREAILPSRTKRY